MIPVEQKLYRELRSFGLLLSDQWWYLTDVSGQPIGTIFRVQELKKTCSKHWKFGKKITTNCCVMTQKSAVVSCFVVEARNLTERLFLWNYYIPFSEHLVYTEVVKLVKTFLLESSSQSDVIKKVQFVYFYMKSLKNKQMTFDGTLLHYMKLILQVKFPQRYLFSSILMV